MMAAALGRTVTAVNKKITALNLRVASTKTTIKREKDKETKNLLQMVSILKSYAPLQCFQEGQLALKHGCWTNAQPIAAFDADEEEALYSMASHHFHCDVVKPLALAETGETKIQGEPEYVSLGYVEQWAAAEGFFKTTGELQERGLTYWKNGTYFSQAQLLMHVNLLRFEHRLQPVALIEQGG